MLHPREWPTHRSSLPGRRPERFPPQVPHEWRRRVGPARPPGASRPPGMHVEALWSSHYPQLDHFPLTAPTSSPTPGQRGGRFSNAGRPLVLHWPFSAQQHPPRLARRRGHRPHGLLLRAGPDHRRGTGYRSPADGAVLHGPLPEARSVLSLGRLRHPQGDPPPPRPLRAARPTPRSGGPAPPVHGDLWHSQQGTAARTLRGLPGPRRQRLRRPTGRVHGLGQPARHGHRPPLDAGPHRGRAPRRPRPRVRPLLRRRRGDRSLGLHDQEHPHAHPRGAATPLAGADDALRLVRPPVLSRHPRGVAAPGGAGRPRGHGRRRHPGHGQRPAPRPWGVAGFRALLDGDGRTGAGGRLSSPVGRRLRRFPARAGDRRPGRRGPEGASPKPGADPVRHPPTARGALDRPRRRPLQHRSRTWPLVPLPSRRPLCPRVAAHRCNAEATPRAQRRRRPSA